MQTGDVQAGPNAPRPWRRWWVVASLAGGAAALVGAIALEPETWAGAIDGGSTRLHEHALAGAGLLRIMLVIGAIALPGAALVLARTAVPSSGTGPDRNGRFTLLLLGIVLVGLLVRLPRLGESLWYDEIAAWREYGTHGPRAIVGTYHDPANHVLHTLATWATVEHDVLGLAPETAMRLPTLVFSLLAIWATAAIGRRAAGSTAGLVAGGLAAIAPVAVLEGTNARGYGAMMAAGAGSLALLLTARERGGGWWLGYALVCAAGCWVHPVTACVPLGHALWLGWRGARGERNLLCAGALSLALAALLAVIAYAPIIPQMLALRGTLSATSADQPTLLGIEGLKMLEQIGGVWWWPAAIPGFALFVIGVIKGARDDDAAPVLAAGFSGGTVFIALVVLTGSWCYARFVLFVVPITLAAAAIGVVHCWRTTRPVALGLAVLFTAGAAADLVRRPPRQPLRDAVDLVIATGGATERGMAVGLRHQSLDVYAGGLDMTWSLHHGRDLPERLPGADPSWLIVTYPLEVDDETYEAIAAHGLREVARLRGWIDWDGSGDVVVYRAAPR